MYNLTPPPALRPVVLPAIFILSKMTPKIHSLCIRLFRHLYIHLDLSLSTLPFFLPPNFLLQSYHTIRAFKLISLTFSIKFEKFWLGKRNLNRHVDNGYRFYFWALVICKNKNSKNGINADCFKIIVRIKKHSLSQDICFSRS